MVFIEVAPFTKYLRDYLNDDKYRELQSFLIEQPEAGDLIQGTGGLRKLRWSMDNKGKCGEIRVIYYWQISEDQIYLFTLLRIKNKCFLDHQLPTQTKNAIKIHHLQPYIDKYQAQSYMYPFGCRHLE